MLKNKKLQIEELLKALSLYIFQINKNVNNY